jgi:hypothetical protein
VPGLSPAQIGLRCALLNHQIQSCRRRRGAGCAGQRYHVSARGGAGRCCRSGSWHTAAASSAAGRYADGKGRQQQQHAREEPPASPALPEANDHKAGQRGIAQRIPAGPGTHGRFYRTRRGSSRRDGEYLI